ncbi:hypothetical protein RIF29_21034 [Crotalaria pallida]|uniref:Uncharacterized protein n=1 Tax=Crotalaria pallida TaxID=3830 RepID=A0AAN9F5R8_CROPI
MSSKSMTSIMFESACDYLKKLDTNWDHQYNGSTSFKNFDEKHLNGFNDAMIENNERLTKLSNLVSTWSIAPPDPEVSSHFDPQTNNVARMRWHEIGVHYLMTEIGNDKVLTLKLPEGIRCENLHSYASFHVEYAILLFVEFFSLNSAP